MPKCQCTACAGRTDELIRPFPSLWWMSFADPTKPRGSQFLGVVILEVPVGVMPIQHSWDEKLNPGGEIAFAEIEGEHQATYRKEFRNRLLSRDELMAAGF